jgi:K+-transporting ATPase ATPase C chain
MGSQIRPALVLFALLTILTGVAYPALVTGIAQVAMPWQANGSLIVGGDGEVIGSELIGQHFDDPRYFWGRLSATASHPFDAAASSGSNHGPTSPALEEAARARIGALRAEDPADDAPVPIDLVTSSASGLDPHITPAAALHQVPRVASARGLPEERVRELVLAHVEERFVGVLGEPRVNVLRLDLALDQLDRMVE